MLKVYVATLFLVFICSCINLPLIEASDYKASLPGDWKITRSNDLLQIQADGNMIYYYAHQGGHTAFEPNRGSWVLSDDLLTLNYRRVSTTGEVEKWSEQYQVIEMRANKLQLRAQGSEYSFKLKKLN
jgi:hypothetical protein